MAQIEQELLHQRSAVDRVSDRITRSVGSISFAIAHLLWFSGWLLINGGAFSGVRPFDPYPFNFLCLVVALESVLLSTFVLMSQNRQRRHTEHWDHLNLQVDLLAEQEMTKMLPMLQTICQHLGLEKAAGDTELKDLVQKTPVEILAQELKKARDRDEPPPAGRPGRFALVRQGREGAFVLFGAIEVAGMMPLLSQGVDPRLVAAIVAASPPG